MDESQRAYEVNALQLPNPNSVTVVNTTPPIVDPALTDPCNHYQ
jgi:hypothetical protein